MIITNIPSLTDSEVNEILESWKIALEEYEIERIKLDLTTERATLHNKKVKLENIKPIYTVQTELPKDSKYKYRSDRYIELKAGRSKIKYRFTDCDYTEDERQAVFTFSNVSDEYGYNLKITAIR